MYQPTHCGVCLDREFKMTLWLAKRRDTIAALEESKGTHQVNVLEAFDSYGGRILPSKYESTLRCADVQVHFQMLHWEINDSDTIVNDIKNMRVVLPPKAKLQPRTPKKRISKIDAFTPVFTPKRLRTE